MFSGIIEICMFYLEKEYKYIITYKHNLKHTCMNMKYHL